MTIILYHCIECEKDKEWSNMNSIKLCKVCWIKAYEKEIADRIKKTWTTRRLKAKVKEIMEL